MDVRQSRLMADFKSLQRFRSRVMTFRVVEGGDVPEVYQVHYDLRSLIGFENDTPLYKVGHDVEIRMPMNYPRVKPGVRITSRPLILHPNVWADDRVCIEDRWIPGVGIPLDKIVEYVGRTIAFQEINLKRPANPDTKMTTWIQARLVDGNFFPLDRSQIRLPDAEDVIRFGDDEALRPRITFGS